MGARHAAIVGDLASVAGFRPLGFTVFPVAVPAAARALWPELTSGEYATVFVTEAVWREVEDLAATLAEESLPAITVIPGAGSADGLGQAKIDAAIERALGTKVIRKAEDV